MTLPQTQGQTIPDAWDFKGRQAERSKTGGWTSAAMILGAEASERLTTMSIAVNLVTYLTGTMHLANASSANIVTNFMGTSFMLCLLGGFIADTFIGRYLTVAIFATVQATGCNTSFVQGVTILTISTIIPSLHPPKCIAGSDTPCIPASNTQLTVLYLALYITALGIGGVKSSVSGFGSDQFDDSDKGSLAAVTIFVYIQDHLGRDWGYGICACAVVVALLVFLSGTKRYRFKKLVGSPLTQIAEVYVAAWRKRHLELPSDSSLLFNLDDVADETLKKKKQMLPHSKQFSYLCHGHGFVVCATPTPNNTASDSQCDLLFLDRAAIKDPKTDGEITEGRKWCLSTLTDVEEVKLVQRMLPIWATTIMFWTVYAQMTTFSVQQATTLNRHIGKSFQIPPASLTAFFIGSILLTVPIYDRIIVPIARKVLKNPQGLTPLQRIGVGLLFSIFAMVAAALSEIKRLRVARLHGLEDNPSAELPMSVFWLVPQFFFVGSGEAFTYIGQLDFFLRECPKGMKTMSTGLFLSTLSLGFFFSSLLVTLVHKVTGHHKPWLADNLNQGKLYNFYWLLAILSALNLGIYLICAKGYVYKDKRLVEEGIELEEADSAFHA
ncbi:PTR2 family proton/oligopeptide symporter, conserved site [Sesbania bispinosa]|nr:PTR2 family proton/oligopeptide symporter, conserved site [Sesbania bispinosa]